MANVTKLSQDELVKKIAKETGYTQKDIKATLVAMGEIVTKTLVESKEDTEIKLFSGVSVGVKATEAHTARNPKTGEVVDVPASRKMYAKLGNTVKNSVK